MFETRMPVWFCALFLMLAAIGAARAEPVGFRPGEIWLDQAGVAINAHGGGILQYRGTYYWFGEHKVGGEAGNLAQVGVHVYSSKTLTEWKDEGIALSVSDDADSDIAKGAIIERPKVLYNKRTKKFVMWFHLELKGQGYRAARNGVAVADTPVGPYRYLGSSRPDVGVWPINVTSKDQIQRPDNPLANDFALGQQSRDMGIFQDDDAKAYLIYASEHNTALHISLLTDDYLHTSGRYMRIFAGVPMEAPALFKWRGRYYLIASGVTGWKANAAHSAVASTIWGPWRDLGNPVRGSEADVATTFSAQSTFVFAAPGKDGRFIFMADRWNPKDAIDGRYVWLPIAWQDGKPVLRWRASWTLSDLSKE